MVIAEKKQCSPKYHLVLQLWMAELSSLTKPIRDNDSLISKNMSTISLVGPRDTYWLVNPAKGGKVYRAFLHAEPKRILEFFSNKISYCNQQKKSLSLKGVRGDYPN